MMKKKANFGLIFIMTLVSNLTIGQKVCMHDLELTDSKYYKGDSLYTGDYECFNDNGVKTETGFINKGILDSTVIYKANGKISEILWYIDNKADTRRLFQNAGNTNLIINLRVISDKDHIEHGSWERFFKNGQLMEQKFYDNGKSVGLWKTWDSKGRILTETDFRNNPIIAKFHGYKKNKHIVIIKYTDKETGKKIRQEKIVNEL
jgi:antitoxin component YwqK of YwqJK toxin-antitoxin module